MIAINKRSIGTLLSLPFFALVMCYYPVRSNYGITGIVANDYVTDQDFTGMPHGHRPHPLKDSVPEMSRNQEQYAIRVEREGKYLEIKPVKNTPRSVEEILSGYYKGANLVIQQRAFERVIRWKEDFEDVAGKYDNVDWKILSSIIKAETQGKTGAQLSYAKALGMPQIKYQGAWAFVWDAMFSEKIKKGSVYVKDYYNEYIRVRYNSQLIEIRKYLEDNSILVHPEGLSKSEEAYRRAKSDSWEKLKVHLKREFSPGEYQVAVDIAAMYIDHLIDILCKIERQLSDIKRYLEHSDVTSLDEIEFRGTKMARWQRIKEHLRRNVKSGRDTRWHELTLSHLKSMLKRLQGPNIYSAAYNFGITKFLEYVESGKVLPNEVGEYVKEVSNYITIFSEIDRCRAFT